MKKYIVLIVSLFFVGCGPNSTSVSTIITESSNFNDFKGKPSVIIFAGTYCPHCLKSMPSFKTDVWDKRKNEANIWVNVIDQKKFEVEGIPQGFNELLTFQSISGEECNYVPSWVVLDEDFKPVKTSCGGGKGAQEINETLDKLMEA